MTTFAPGAVGLAPRKGAAAARHRGTRRNWVLRSLMCLKGSLPDPRLVQGLQQHNKNKVMRPESHQVLIDLHSPTLQAGPGS